MNEAYIFDHVRTPRGKGKPTGALHEVTPVDLTSQILAALRERTSLSVSELDDVVLGVVCGTGEQGGGVARSALINAGFPEEVPGYQLNRFCSSGLDAVTTAAAQIMSGQANLIIAGGCESMSRVPAGSDGGAWRSDPPLVDKMKVLPVGIAADTIATLNGFTREDTDYIGLTSHQRASAAWSKGYFSQSVVPVVDEIGLPLLDKDESVRDGVTLEGMATLAPAFEKMARQSGLGAYAVEQFPHLERVSHVHTAATASGIVDGAAGVLIGSRQAGEALGLTPRARIRAWASTGANRTLQLTGAVPATKKALKNAGMSVDDIDLFEVNEAFASVVLWFMKETDVPHDRINVNGGAIAMGHPTGATGAMLLGTALDELERSGKQSALITLCAALGMGSAAIIERI